MNNEPQGTRNFFPLPDRLILGSDPDKPRKIGNRYCGVVWSGESYPDQPFVVLREATYEEWRAQDGREVELPFEPTEAHFYEVSLD